MIPSNVKIHEKTEKNKPKKVPFGEGGEEIVDIQAKVVLGCMGKCMSLDQTKQFFYGIMVL